MLGKDVGVALDLVFYFENEDQSKYLFQHVKNVPLNPNKPASENDNPLPGVIVPIHVSITRGGEVIYVGRRDTKSANSWSAATSGHLNRSIYGKVLPKGKYQIEVTNLQAQSVFKGYRVEVKIPGDRKV